LISSRLLFGVVEVFPQLFLTRRTHARFQTVFPDMMHVQKHQQPQVKAQQHLHAPQHQWTSAGIRRKNTQRMKFVSFSREARKFRVGAWRLGLSWLRLCL